MEHIRAGSHVVTNLQIAYILNHSVILEIGMRKDLTANKYVGLRIREIRDALGLTQQELANELGWQQTKLSRMERGVTPITVEELDLAAHVLGRTYTHFFPRIDIEELTQLEQQLLDLFRQLDGDMRRMGALQFIIELRDEEESFAERTVLWKPESVSSKYEQLKRWIGAEEELTKIASPLFEENEEPEEEITVEAAPLVSASISKDFLADLTIQQSDRADEVKGIYWAPYLDELEFRAFRELAMKIQADLRYALDNNKWESFDSVGYQMAIEEIKRFHGRKR